MRTLAKLNVCMAVLMIAGCGGKIIRPHYYVLEAPPTLPDAQSSRQIAATVAVSEFGAPPYLRQGRIVYRQSAEEIGFYEYRRWAIDPAETVTATMMNSLRARQLFSMVKRYDGRNEQGYLMTGRLERLEEVDYEGPVRVKAEISAELVNLRSGSTEWTGDASATFHVETSDMDSVVAQMNHAVQSCVGQLAASLTTKMDQRLAANSK